MTSWSPTGPETRENRSGSIAQRAEVTSGANGWTTAGAPELGVRPLTMLDGPLGVVSRTMDERDSSTLFPCGTSLAATFDTDLVTRIGELVGAEADRHGADVVLGPNLNLPRGPYSGRSFEMFSEDPALTAAMGVAWISGVQSQGISACAKHLVCNDTEARRQSYDVRIRADHLREIYLLPFEAAVAAGVGVVLTAYNRVLGEHCSQNAELLRILKAEWGFDGVAVSDWFGVRDTVAASTAGLDLEMPGPPRYFGPGLALAVEEGKVPSERLDDAFDRLLRLARRTQRAAPKRSRCEPRAADLLREAAAAGTVLLRNEGVLPLNPAPGRRTLIVGPNADRPCLQGGTFARVTPDTTPISPLTALTQALQPGDVVYAPGCATEELLPLTELRTTAPSGAVGVLVEYAPAGSREFTASQIRAGSSFVWFGDLPGIGAPGLGGRLRLSAIIVPDRSGDHEFHLGGTGSGRLLIDGAEVVSWQGPDASDVMGVVARAETAAGRCRLTVGAPVRVVAEIDLPTGGRVQALTVGFRPPQDAGLLSEAVEHARTVDDVVLVLGDSRSASRESADRSTTELPPDQLGLLEAVLAVAPHAVVVLNTGHPVDTRWSHRTGAVVVPWYAGQEFGPALAEVLIGTREPGGRLPVTFAARDEDYPGTGLRPDAEDVLDYEALEPAGVPHWTSGTSAPAFAFGAGLGYTTWEWATPEVDQVGGGPLRVHVAVRNTGTRAGHEVVQVYVAAPFEKGYRLAGFAKVGANAGEIVVAQIELEDNIFRRWSTDEQQWFIPNGNHRLFIGRSSFDVTGVTVAIPK